MLKVAKKYIVAFSPEKEKEILRLIKHNWDFEVIEARKESKEDIDLDLQEVNYKVSSADFAISFLNSFAEKESFFSKMKTPKIKVDKSNTEDFHDAERVGSLIEETISLEKNLKITEKELKDFKDKIKELEQFGKLGFVPMETEHTSSFIAKINKKQEQAFKDFIFGKRAFQKKINEEQAGALFSVICLKSDKEEIIKFLEDIKGSISDYAFSSTPEKEIKSSLKEIKFFEEEQKEINKRLAEVAKSLKDIKIYHDILSLGKRQLEVKRTVINNGFLGYILFWADEEEKNRFEKAIKSICEDSKIVEVKLQEDERPPVSLENKGLVKPFQAVTDIFGLPSDREIDPTPYLSLFFIIFFGICITDAGYGLLLALFTGLALILFKERFAKNNLVKLLFYGGISTFIAGVLFGSYFGVGPEEIGLPFMKAFKVIDPIKDTVLFMGLAFFLGYLQICFSQVVKMIKAGKIKNRDEFFSGMTWLVFYLFLGVYSLSLTFPFLKTIGIAGLILFGAGLFLVESKGQKIFLKPLVGGIKILQGLISTMSDILSYSRLMALGLGTGVIALIVNQIAFLFGDMIPYVGWLVSAVILAGGHLFNLGINALGGFIHSARLQFVEFFPKFMEGGGRRLDSIDKELRYIKINN